MASDKQIEANRRNAQKSTGPRTVEGKAKAAGNAIKHGLLSRRIVLDCEDAEEFEAFRAAMVGDLRPAGAVEDLLADHAVASAWREISLAMRGSFFAWRKRPAPRAFSSFSITGSVPSAARLIW